MYRLCIVYIVIIAVCLLQNCSVLCSSSEYFQGPRIIDSRTRHVSLHIIQPSHVVVWRSGFHVSPFPPVSITRVFEMVNKSGNRDVLSLTEASPVAHILNKKKNGIILVV